MKSLYVLPSRSTYTAHFPTLFSKGRTTIKFVTSDQVLAAGQLLCYWCIEVNGCCDTSWLVQNIRGWMTSQWVCRNEWCACTYGPSSKTPLGNRQNAWSHLPVTHVILIILLDELVTGTRTRVKLKEIVGHVVSGILLFYLWVIVQQYNGGRTGSDSSTGTYVGYYIRLSYSSYHVSFALLPATDRWWNCTFFTTVQNCMYYSVVRNRK